MPYRVTNSDLFNKAGDVIAKQGALIEISDLPILNRVSVHWLIEQGYLVPEDAPLSVESTPTPSKRDRKE
jgi:hypothetical protein